MVKLLATAQKAASRGLQIVARVTSMERAILSWRLRRAFDKHLVFCLTNGRSGSGTLARLFKCIHSVEARHEPHPKFSGIMRQVQTSPDLARSFLLDQKLPAIGQSDKHVYVETSHLFAKGFFDPLLATGIRPSFVVLRRETRSIALSMLSLGTIPGRTEKGMKWYLAPSDRVLIQLPNWRNLTDYQLCYWHALETEARQRVYADQARQAELKVVEIAVDELGKKGEFERMCRSLSIECNPEDLARIEVIRGQARNCKARKKSYYSRPADPATEEAEVRILAEEGPAFTRNVARIS